MSRELAASEGCRRSSACTGGAKQVLRRGWRYNPADVPATSAVATLTVFVGGFVPAGAGLGEYTVTNGLFTINAAGEDIERTQDRFFYVKRHWSAMAISSCGSSG